MLTGLWTDPTNNDKIRFTLEESLNYQDFSPCTQSYGFCFNDKGKLLVGRCKGILNEEWVLPGGTIEKDETPVQALHREFDEEVSVMLKKEQIIGIQRMEFLEKDKATKYQLRFACILDELKELTPDPDNGYLWERKFIDIKDFLDHIPWGEIGKELLNRAKEWFEQEKKSI